MADPAVLVAVKTGDLQRVEQLIHNGELKVNEPDENGETYLSVAAAEGHEPIVSALLLAGASHALADWYGRTPLFSAALNGHESVAVALLRAGADYNVADRDRWTPLRAAVGGGHESFVIALLRAGADPNVADTDRCTPLWVAAKDGSTSIVSALLEAGADHKLAGRDGETPLWVSSRWPWGRDAVVSLLLRAGADPNVADEKEGYTPLIAAILGHRRGCVRLLLSAGALRDTRSPPALDVARSGWTNPEIVSVVHAEESAALYATEAAIERALGVLMPEFMREVFELAFSREVVHDHESSKRPLTRDDDSGGTQSKRPKFLCRP